MLHVERRVIGVVGHTDRVIIGVDRRIVKNVDRRPAPILESINEMPRVNSQIGLRVGGWIQYSQDCEKNE